MKTLTNAKDGPKKQHFAAVVFSSIYIEGDERSRTNPGHGYPAEWRSTSEYIVFDDEAEMNEWVRARVDNKEKNYIILRAEPLLFTLMFVSM